MIDSRLRSGRYRTISAGVYALGPLSPRGRHVAALMAGGPGAALSHASALAAFGLMTTRPTIDVAVRTNRRAPTELRFHRLALDASELTHRDGLRTTTIARALLDVAATGADVRRLAHEAIAKRLTSQRELQNLADRHHGRPGAPTLRGAANEPHTRSNLERRFLRFLDAHGLPRPLTNQKIGPYTVDGLYPDHNLAIEVDEDGHRTAQAFEDDRERDRYLVARGYRVMRVTAESLAHELAHLLRQALASPPT